MTNLTILLEDSYRPESFPAVLDLSKVTKLKLEVEISTSLTSFNLRCIIDLLKQTSNIQSLTIHGSSFVQRHPSSIEKIHSIIISHVDRSKLRHLEISVCNLNQVQTLFDRFGDLFSIRLLPETESLTSKQIVAFVKGSMPHCLIMEEFPVVFIWIAKHVTPSTWFSRGIVGLFFSSINRVARRLNRKHQC